MFDSKNAKCSDQRLSSLCQPGSKLVKHLKSKRQKENSQFVLFTKLFVLFVFGSNADNINLKCLVQRIISSHKNITTSCF